MSFTLDNRIFRDGVSPSGSNLADLVAINRRHAIEPAIGLSITVPIPHAGI